MNPLIVKGVVFGLLLACAALWDMKEREIPNLIRVMVEAETKEICHTYVDEVVSIINKKEATR